MAEVEKKSVLPVGRAVQQFLAGAPLDVVAERMGVGVEVAHSRLLRKIGNMYPSDNVDSVRAVLAARLEALYQAAAVDAFTREVDVEDKFGKPTGAKRRNPHQYAGMKEARGALRDLALLHGLGSVNVRVDVPELGKLEELARDLLSLSDVVVEADVIGDVEDAEIVD